LIAIVDYFFIPPRGLGRGSCTRARHLDLERRATRLTDYVAAGGCGEPFYDPFDRHEKYDGKLYEVDRGRRRGLHLYLHRIYFTTTSARPRTPALFLPCMRDGHREGEWPCGVFYRRPVDRRRGGSCNLRIRAPRSGSIHRDKARRVSYPSAMMAASQWRRGISPRRPYIETQIFTLGNPSAPRGAGPRRGEQKAGDFYSSLLHSVVFSASAKLQRYPIIALFCSTGARPKLQRYPLFRA